MTRLEIINGMRDAWTAALLDERDLREELADSYAAWVQGLMARAAPELQGKPAAGGEKDEGAEGQDGQAPQGPEAQGQGGMM